MKTYEIEVNRNDSTIVRVAAKSLKEAYQIAADDQSVPNVPASFGYVGVVATPKQISRTKSLMRGL